jgi:heterodisulfide reductase subunit A
VTTAEDGYSSQVLIVGAGIAGMQAALDIANSGYQVVLVERLPSIGGHMHQLSETFPTLDCAQCIMTPRTVDVGRHENIHLYTYSEIEDISGEMGNFQVRIRRKPAYVNWDTCTGCGSCSEVCPLTIGVDFDRRLEMPEVMADGKVRHAGTRKAIYTLSPQAVPNKYTIDKRGWPPCKDACPAHIDVQGYVALIGQRRFADALALVRRTIPFPGVIGRVCNHPCETACNRAEFDQPVAICALKRFLADFEQPTATDRQQDTEAEQEPAAENKLLAAKKVAVIGAGPAGLTAAHDLALEGCSVTVFEALPVAGGMLAVGIPDYRQPRDVLDQEIARIEALGVEIRLNTSIGGDGGPSLKDLRRDHDAVFVCVGAHQERRLRIMGEDLEGVAPGAVFLRKLNLGQPVVVGKRVAVVGGGNVAIDAARSTLRLGAESVTIVYRRSRAEMPAGAWEVEDAEEEGVHFRFLANPIRILGQDGRVVGLECVRMELGEPDASGRRRPIPIEGSDFVLDVDMVIPAIGQTPDLRFMGAGDLQVTRWGTLAVDPESLATDVPGVFAGGDAVSGPATAIEALAAGKRAAQSIRCYLQGEELDRLEEGACPEPVAELPVVTFEELDLLQAQKSPRVGMPKLVPETRTADFAEVELGFTEEQAVAEALRCLNCGVCSECRQCELVCPVQAVDHQQGPAWFEERVGAIILATGYELYPLEELGEYGGGHVPDVLDSLAMERLLSASGPTAGVMRRPSDGKEPKEVVWIQCAGSRDPELAMPYCSKICCMYSAKQAMLYKHKVHDGQAYIFYIDIRSAGKHYEEFIQRAMEEDGVLYVRGKVSKVFRENGRVMVWGVDTLTGLPVEVAADLVVISPAMVASEGTREMAEMLGLEVDQFGWWVEQEGHLAPLNTNRPGIFLAGTGIGPKDIPEAVSQGSGAAGKVISLLTRWAGP